jgi:hypothetical protein
MNRTVLTKLKRAIKFNLDELAGQIIESHGAYLSKRNMLNLIRYMDKLNKHPYKVVRYAYNFYKFMGPFDRRYIFSLHSACYRGHTNVVHILLKYGTYDDRYPISSGDPSANSSYAIRIASQYGFADIVRLLLEDGRADPAANNNYAIKFASQYGNAEVVKLLLADKRVDPADSYVLRFAVENGHTEIVQLLLADGRADPSADSSLAIRSAVKYRQEAILRMLLKDGRADPSVMNNLALNNACEYGSVEIVRILLNDDRIDPAANKNAALRYAIDYRHINVIRLLLADRRVVEAGLTLAIAGARRWKDAEIIFLLMGAGK